MTSRVSRPQTDPARGPSFEGFKPASPASSRAKRANRASDTTAELLLRRALWRLGLRYRKNVKDLPGKPDVVFPNERLVVFCDGDFWHGRNWKRLKKQLERRANATYWVAKIAANRARDTLYRRELRKAGWTVHQVWESEIRSSPEAVAGRIAAAVSSSARAAMSLERGEKPCPLASLAHVKTRRPAEV